MSEEKKKILLSAIKRAAHMSDQGGRLRTAFRRNQIIAEEEGREAPPIPPQLFAANLEKVADMLIAGKLQDVLAAEAELLKADAAAMVDQAQAAKERAEQVLVEIESAAIEKEVKEG